MFPILSSLVQTLLELVSNQKQNILFKGIQFKYCAEVRIVFLQISHFKDPNQSHVYIWEIQTLNSRRVQEQ